MLITLKQLQAVLLHNLARVALSFALLLVTNIVIYDRKTNDEPHKCFLCPRYRVKNQQ